MASNCSLTYAQRPGLLARALSLLGRAHRARAAAVPSSWARRRRNKIAGPPAEADGPASSEKGPRLSAHWRLERCALRNAGSTAAVQSGREATAPRRELKLSGLAIPFRSGSAQTEWRAAPMSGGN